MDAFTAVADPTRRQVLDLLHAGERPAGELASAFPNVTQPAISRHLRVLREAGLVNVRSEQQRRVYSLRPEGFSELSAWVSKYREFWNTQLDALTQHLDARAKSTRSTKRSKRS